jgi:hypothetical protein
VNHTRFPKEDHQPDRARRDNQVKNGARVHMGSCYVIGNTWVKGIGEVIPAKTIKAYGGCKSISPLILNPSTRWRWVINFTPRPFKKKQLPYPLNGRLGGPQSWSGRFEKESLAPLRIQTPYRPARSLVTIPTGWFKMQWSWSGTVTSGCSARMCAVTAQTARVSFLGVCTRLTTKQNRNKSDTTARARTHTQMHPTKRKYFLDVSVFCLHTAGSCSEVNTSCGASSKMKKMKMRIQAWLRLALHSSHHK